MVETKYKIDKQKAEAYILKAKRVIAIISGLVAGKTAGEIMRENPELPFERSLVFWYKRRVKG